MSLRRFRPLRWNSSGVVNENIEARIGGQKTICEVFHLLPRSGAMGKEQTPHARYFFEVVPNSAEGRRVGEAPRNLRTSVLSIYRLDSYGAQLYTPKLSERRFSKLSLTRTFEEHV